MRIEQRKKLPRESFQDHTGARFRVKRKRGGARSSAVVAARDARSANCTNIWLEALQRLEPEQQPDPPPF